MTLFPIDPISLQKKRKENLGVLEVVLYFAASRLPLAVAGCLGAGACELQLKKWLALPIVLISSD